MCIKNSPSVESRETVSPKSHPSLSPGQVLKNMYVWLRNERIFIFQHTSGAGTVIDVVHVQHNSFFVTLTCLLLVFAYSYLDALHKVL